LRAASPARLRPILFCFAVENVGDQHIDAVPIDLAVGHHDFLFLDPRALNVVERLVCPGDSFLDGVLKAFLEVAVISMTLATDMIKSPEQSSIVACIVSRPETYRRLLSHDIAAMSGLPLPLLRTSVKQVVTARK
jgi:hypothetical protein